MRDPYIDTITVRESEGSQKTNPIRVVRGDLYLDPSAHKGSFDMADWLMTRLRVGPGRREHSLVLKTDREYRINGDGTPMLDADGEELPPLWRPTALHASDVVDTGDAVDGLLSVHLAAGDAAIDETWPNGILWKAEQMLTSHFAGKPREFVAEHLEAYLSRYLDRRYGETLGTPAVTPPAESPAEILRARLQDVLAVLRAQAWLYHTSHWQTMGPNFFGQHLLFERLYYGLPDQYDALAEKSVALFGPQAVEPLAAISAAASLLKEWVNSDHVAAGLVSEAPAHGRHRHGPESRRRQRRPAKLLAGLGRRAHQTNVYLLQQVSGGVKPSDAWRRVPCPFPPPVTRHPPPASPCPTPRRPTAG